MKKLLFLSFITLSIMGSAQILVSEGFENPTYPGFTITGGLPGSTTTYTGGACDGNVFIAGEVNGTTVENKTLNLIYTKPAEITANGKKIDITFSYNAFATAMNYVGGTITVAYSTDGGTTYTPVGNTITLDYGNLMCEPFAGTIPETANVNGNFMLRIQTIAASGAAVKFLSGVDKIRIKQEVTSAPTCTTISSPANGATGVSVRPNITWNAIAGAETYKIKIGTTPGSSNIYSGSTFYTSFTPLSSDLLPVNTLLYLSVTPSNALGDATGCQEISFTTGNNPFAPYCGPLTSTFRVIPISNIQLSNMTNASTSTTVAHEDFTNKVATVNRGTSYPITLQGNGVGIDKRYAFTVFIDWNQNEDFTDAGEDYFVTSDFAGGAAESGSTITVNKNIQVPANATLGNTRMRVKYQADGKIPVREELSNPCAELVAGQIEDYTINVTDNSLATSEVGVNKKAEISINPNPFKDILKISDTKGVKSITITDVAGRQLKRLKANNEINLSDLGSGLYLIGLQMEDGSVKTLKAIKK